MVRVIVGCVVGILSVCLLYAFSLPASRTDWSLQKTPRALHAKIPMNMTCSSKLVEMEMLQYMKYSNSLKQGKLPSTERIQHGKRQQDMIAKFHYSFSFVEGKDDTCLAVFMKERFNGKQTSGKSHFRVEVDSKYTINVCSVDDYADGTYHILCPITERCSSIRITLMYVNDTAYQDVYGSHAIGKRILRKLYCKTDHQDGLIKSLFTTSNRRMDMKSTPQCHIRSRGFVSWVQDKYRNRKVAVDKCIAQHISADYFDTCISDISEIIFIGGEFLQVYYHSLMYHFKYSDTPSPVIKFDNIKTHKYTYIFANTTKSVARSIGQLSQSISNRTIVVFGGWTLQPDMLTKNVSMGSARVIKNSIKKLKASKGKSVELIWMPYSTLTKNTVRENKTHTCCYGNDFAFLPVNVHMMSKAFGPLGVDTFDVAYHASRIESCNTVHKTRSPCKKTDSSAPYKYINYSIQHSFLHYLCGISRGLPVTFYS